jgi:hypothetical protein
MASGIRSAAPAILRVLMQGTPRVPVKHAIPEAQQTQASPLITPEFPMAPGTLLAHQEANPVLPAGSPAGSSASTAASVGEAVGVGWVWGFGWPYWGFGWGVAWNPWWYNPYGYGAWPAYGYPYYDNWYDDPPYQSNSSYDYDNDSPTSYLNRPSSNDSSNDNDSYFNLSPSSAPGDSGAVQNGQTPQPETVPASPAPETQPQPGVVSQGQN